MTQTVDLPLPSERAAENKLVGNVCFAHFVSHYYIMLLAPLFCVRARRIRRDLHRDGPRLYGVQRRSTALQTPAGFLVDRVSARIMLIAGLLIGACAFAIAGLVNSFWVFVAMFGVAGLANTVYHPADYSLLSHHVPAERAGRVFSFHTFAGMMGNAASPATLIYLQTVVGWRGAMLVAAALGVISAIILMLQGEPPEPAHAVPRSRRARRRRSIRPLKAGGCCCRRRSCSISFSSSCSRSPAAGSTTTWWRRSARCTAPRSRWRTPRSPAS